MKLLTIIILTWIMISVAEIITIPAGSYKFIGEGKNIYLSIVDVEECGSEFGIMIIPEYNASVDILEQNYTDYIKDFYYLDYNITSKSMIILTNEDLHSSITLKYTPIIDSYPIILCLFLVFCAIVVVGLLICIIHMSCRRYNSYTSL